MSAWRTIGAVLGAVLIGGAVVGTPPRAFAETGEPGSAASLVACSDPDSFGGAADIGTNQLAVEKIGAPAPRYRLVARWRRWDGQDLAESAARDLDRAIDWGSARLVLRLREESLAGVTLLTNEQVMDGAEFSAANSPDGALAAVDVDPALLWPKSGGSVSVKVRVERPGLDLATCWAGIPSMPTLDGAARSSGALDFAAMP
jgi:hypothetical protein